MPRTLYDLLRHREQRRTEVAEAMATFAARVAEGYAPMQPALRLWENGEVEAPMPDEYITSPTGQHWLTYRAIRSGSSGVDWLTLARHAMREARGLHPDRDPMNTAGGILAGFLRYHFTPRPEVPGLDLRADLLAWACGRVDWPYVAGLLLADLAGMEAQDAETTRPHGEPAENSCSTNGG
jgi:hypothetical protein